MVRQSFVLLLLIVVAITHAKYFNRPPRLPFKLQANPKFWKLHDSDKIFGGTVVEPYSIPYQVSFQTTSGFHFCGGSVFDETTILTAGHCCADETVSSVKIVAAEHNLAINEGYEQERNIRRIIIHEDFDIGTFTNDICILKLDRPLTFNSGPGAVGELSVPDSTFDFQAGSPATVAGWGVTESGSTKLLMSAEVFIDSDEDCTAAYDTVYQPKIHICASAPNKDACQGDSGGPLACKTSFGPLNCGIVSWGYGCAVPEFPGVYTRTKAYYDWIHNNV